MTVIHSLYRESGNVTIDPDACTHCGLCVRTCPAEVLSIGNEKINIHTDSPFGCIACGHCMMVCPHEAITVTGRGLSPNDIQPLPSPEKIATADQLAALMKKRRSVRTFTDKPVDPALLDRIVEMASTAPMGIPPWDIGCVIINGKENVRKLTDDIIKGYTGFLKVFKPWLLKAMRPFIGKAKYDIFTDFIRPLAETYVRAHRQGRDVVFYEAPAVLIFHHSPYTEAVDASIACTYAMLAAESLGLGSTIIGGAAPIIQRNKELSRSLGIPEGNTPAIALILGHPAASFKKTIKRQFATINTVT